MNTLTSELEALIAQLNTALATKNIALYDALMVDDPSCTVVGTGRNEFNIGLAQVRAQAQRDWAAFESLSFNWTVRSANSAGDVAWAACDGLAVVGVGGQRIETPMRMTLVAQKVHGAYRVAQAHVSVPDMSGQS